MKKLLLVFTVAAFLTACNGNSTNTESTSDSTNVTTPATTDTTTNAMSTDTTHTMGTDSTHAADSTQK